MIKNELKRKRGKIRIVQRLYEEEERKRTKT